MSWFRKKEEPKKKVSIDLVLLMKTKEYVSQDRQKQVSEGMTQEKQLYDMLRAPQRNRKDEEYKIQKIVRVLNQIEAYDKIVILVSQLDNLIGQVVNCQGDASKIPQIMPYIASICFYIERTNDLRGAVDIKLKMNEYFNCDVATTFEKSVDPAGFSLFQPLNITSPAVVKYAGDFSKKYQILDVPGLQQPSIPPSQPSGGFPNQYPNSGGSTQTSYQQPYQQPYSPGLQQPQQQAYNQAYQPNYPQQGGGGYPQQNNSQTLNPYEQLNRNAYNLYTNNPNNYLPQIQQPVIGIQQNRNSNYNYPNPSSIFNSKSNQQSQQGNNFNFVPLQPPTNNYQQQQQQQPIPQVQPIPQAQPQVDPFAALDALNNIQKFDLPPPPQPPQPPQGGQSGSLGYSASNNPYSYNQFNIPSQSMGQSQANNFGVSQSIKPVDNSTIVNQNNNQNIVKQPSNYAPPDEIQQQGYSQTTFQVPPSTNRQQIDNQQRAASNQTGQFNNNDLHSQNSRGTNVTDPLASDIGVFETKIIGNQMEESQKIEPVPKPQQVPLNHDLRSLEILRKYREKNSDTVEQCIQQMQIAVMDI